MGLKQVLSLWVRVDLRVVAMKGDSIPAIELSKLVVKISSLTNIPEFQKENVWEKLKESSQTTQNAG